MRWCVNARIPRHERAVLTAWPRRGRGGTPRTSLGRLRGLARRLVALPPVSRPGLCQPRIPEDRKERSASAVRDPGTSFFANAAIAASSRRRVAVRRRAILMVAEGECNLLAS